MDADRALRPQKGHALLELLLLAPLFLALVLATLFFVHALNARLAVIQACRDTALGLARDSEDRGPQAVLEALLQERGLASLGRWSATLEAALPSSDPPSTSPLVSVLGGLVAERLRVRLELPTPRWLPGGPWRFEEQATFKRDPWKAPYAKALHSLLNLH